MRSRLTPDALLLGVVLLLTLGIAIFAVQSGRNPEEESVPRRTTYSAAPGGYQALYETLAALHYPVGRWRRSLDQLAGPGTLILAEPESPPTTPEWLSLAEWVQRGNLLIYLSESGGDRAGRIEEAMLPEPPVQTSHPVQPTAPALAAPQLRTRVRFHIPAGDAEPEAGNAAVPSGSPSRGLPDLLTEAPLVPLYADSHGTTVAYRRWGAGAVVRCSSAWSLANTGVGAGDNFAWLLATLAAYGPRAGVQAFRRSGVRAFQGSDGSDGSVSSVRFERLNARTPERLSPVWFDEYHHGYHEARGVLSLLAPVARLGLAQLVLAWLLLTYAASRRFGGRVPEEARVRRSRSEYLGSMASLLRRARAADLAMAQTRRQFLHDVTRALGLPRDAETGALLAAADTRGVDPEQLRSLLERAERLTADRNAGRPDEALAVARELAGLRQQITQQP